MCTPSFMAYARYLSREGNLWRDEKACPTLGPTRRWQRCRCRPQPMPMRPSTHRPRRRGRLIEELRRAIDCLPTRTREAMLEGIARNERIIVGAYVDGEGGICPMLAGRASGS